MIIRNGLQEIELSLVETISAIDDYTRVGLPGLELRFDVAVRCSSYSGNARVAIWGPDWERFISGMVEFERTRRGEIELQSMDPTELRLRFYAIDPAGHIAVEGEIGERRVYANPVRMVKLGFNFDLDPEFLSAIRDDVRMMVQL